MEKMPANKKESGVSKIVGADVEEEKDILDFFKQLFEKGGKNLVEKEHPEELSELITAVNGFLRKFLKRYGLDSVDIPAENIHIVDRARLTPEQIGILDRKYKDRMAVYVAPTQQIMFFRDYAADNKMEFTQALVHEMLHLNSFLSLQKQKAGKIYDYKLTTESESGQEDIFLKYRRLGFRIYSSDDKTYFYDTDEAIITELSMRFDWKYFSRLPLLAEEYKGRQETIKRAVRQLGESAEELKKKWAVVKIVDGKIVAIKNYSHKKERAGLDELISDLYEKNKSDFSSREEIFGLFAKASLTGRLLPIAKLIEKTYGKGSFKQLGEKTQDKKEQE